MRAVISTRIDTSDLMRAQAIFQEYSLQVPSQGLNRTVLFVLRAAQKNTPFVTGSRIDTELSVSTTPVLSTRGARKGLPLRSGRKNVAVTEGGMATRIVLARMHRGSAYNQRTDQKYFIERAGFSSGGAAGFWKRVEQTAQRMVKSRHSSTHFFQATWGVLIQKILPDVPPGYRGGGAIGPGRDANPTLGDVEPARAGTLTPACTVENRMGMSEVYPRLDFSRNAAAFAILAPALQAAIDAEYESKMEEASRRGWIERQGRLAACGFTIDI